MEDENSILPPPKHTPWNKGKLIGAKPLLLARHVWSIRTKLQIERRARELAMFNLAIDSKLRGCDVVAMKVEDVAPSGYPLARATVRQRKTGRPVRFELTEQTRQAVDDYLKATGKVPGEFLFTRRRRVGEAMTTRQYARLVAEWITGIGLDPHIFATRSLRRTKATLIYRRTGNLRAAGSWEGVVGFQKTPIRFACGVASWRISNSFAAISVKTIDRPVMFPPGCAKLSTWPSPTGSA